jgi:DNA-binding XRE family transcriptional regulator
LQRARRIAEEARASLAAIVEVRKKTGIATEEHNLMRKTATKTGLATTERFMK